MDDNIAKRTTSVFDSIRHTDENDVDYWLARELATALGYSWEGFLKVVLKAEAATRELGILAEHHFRHVSKIVKLGAGSTRDVGDIQLTRYACYVTVQNGNSAKKPAVAEAKNLIARANRIYGQLLLTHAVAVSKLALRGAGAR